MTPSQDKNKKDIIFTPTILYAVNNPLANITYKCPAKGGKLTPDSNILGTRFFFKPDNLYEVDQATLGKFLTSIKIKTAVKQPDALAKAKTLDEMRKGLELLKTEYEKNVTSSAKAETDNAAPDKAKEKADAQHQKAFFSDAITAVNIPLDNLVKVENTITAHHAFIAELEKATFEASVSWVVEPSEADKGSFEKLTDDQKTVHAVVPASK